MAKVNRKKIVEYAAIRGAFHWRQPGDIEVGRFNPPSSPKLRMRTLYVYWRIRVEKPDEEIVMRLAPETPLRLAGRKLVTIWSFRCRDLVGIGGKAQFLDQLSRECFLAGLVRVNSSLWKLPGARDIASFTDQNLSGAVLNNARHRWSVKHWGKSSKAGNENASLRGMAVRFNNA